MAAEPHGNHRSAPLRVESPRYGYPVVDLYLWADSYTSEGEWTPTVGLRLTLSDGEWVESIATYELAPGQVRALGVVASEVADQAGNDAGGEVAP
jgi:hypothetical protein